MKIRSDFVTNSSSSSFVALEIKSPLLNDVIANYSKLLSERDPDAAERFPLVAEDEGCITFSDEDGFNFTDVPNSLGTLVQRLCEGIYELAESDDLPHNEAAALIRVLKGHERQITETIQAAHWLYTDQGRDEFCDPTTADQECIDSIRQEIADDEHRSIDTVTEDDYLEYVKSMGMWMMTEREYTYNRKDNDETYRSDRYLDC